MKKILKLIKFNFKYLFCFICLIFLLIFIGYILYSKTYSTIEGNLRYPANNTPIQTVCAINAVSKEENCTEGYTGKDDLGFPMSFKLKVKPGRYYIYSIITKDKNDSRWDDLISYRAFYTNYTASKCYWWHNPDEEDCKQLELTKRPELINLKSGEILSEVEFDWDNGDFYEEIVLDKKPGITITPTNIPTPTDTPKPTLIPTSKPKPTISEEDKAKVKTYDDYFVAANTKINNLNRDISSYQTSINNIKQSSINVETTPSSLAPSFATDGNEGYVSNPMIDENYKSNMYNQYINTISQFQNKINQANTEINTIKNYISLFTTQKNEILQKYK